MPKYHAPNSDVQRLAFLQTAHNAGVKDRSSGNNYLSADLLTQISTFLPTYQSAYEKVSAQLSQRTKEVRERNEAVAVLQTYVRDFWEVLRRRVIRLNQPAEVLQFYQLPLDGTNPNLANHGEWLNMGQLIVQGEAAAVAAGYPAMINPSVAEVQTVLTRAQAEAADVAGADRTYDVAQELVAGLRPQADMLIQEVMDELRYQLRKKDSAGQRRIMRTYGATFRYLAGEPEDEVEAVAEAV
jgi:hypothetical protein